MIRKQYSYTLWEDFHNGMYEIPVDKNNNSKIKEAIDLLSDLELFYKVCLNVIDDWKISTDENLSNIYINRKAWLGQAACSYKYKICEMHTKKAWWLLTPTQRTNADKVAERIIKIYEEEYRRLYIEVGVGLLF